MNTTLRLRAAVPFLAATLLLAGCSSTPAPAHEKAAAAEQGGAAASAATQAPAEAKVLDTELAKGKTDLGDKGVITSVVRAVTADDTVMHLQYALTREGGDPDASAGLSSLGIGNAPTVTDPGKLVAYRPFCAEGSWTGGAIEQEKCSLSVLGSVPNTINTNLEPGETLEIGVLLPAPEGKPAKVDVLLGDGLPGFSQVPVTYVDDAR